jgi:hypothetical protein
LATIVVLQACTTLPRLAAVPPTQTTRAIIPGFPNIRYWLDEDLPALLQEVIRDDKRERESLARLGISTDPMPPATCSQFQAVATLWHLPLACCQDGAPTGLGRNSSS